MTIRSAKARSATAQCKLHWQRCHQWWWWCNWAVTNFNVMFKGVMAAIVKVLCDKVIANDARSTLRVAEKIDQMRKTNVIKGNRPWIWARFYNRRAIASIKLTKCNQQLCTDFEMQTWPFKMNSQINFAIVGVTGYSFSTVYLILTFDFWF